jgi:transposase
MAITDSDGLPISISIASGSRHDVALTDQALDEAHVDWLPPNLVGDKAWDSKKHHRQLKEERNIELIAPVRSNSSRQQDGRRMKRYKRRWKVERLFAWLQNFRRLIVRWEHKAENSLGFLQLGCIVILLRHL